ncbi:MAG: hypothetical protein OQJ81_09550 [Melioribacteraceae bacterium]|nr:hypothetical protein [Melioribacteraceae bacterium]
MDIFHLEDHKVKLLAELQHDRSPLDQLRLLNDFFQKVKESNDPNIFEVYSAEFFSNYFNSIRNLSVIGLNPKICTPIISDTKNLLKIIMPSEKAEEINTLFHKITQDSQKIENSLNGIKTEEENNSPSFPVIMKNINADYYYGQIEKFSIKIHKDSALRENRFLIIPSSEKIEQRLEEQIRISWDIAITYLKNYYKKPSNFHEVVLIFEHRYANIEGYSLGVAITLGFIQELFRFYNTPLKLSLCTNITFTGGFESDKTLKPIGAQIITNKVDTVFYSANNYFALPDSDLIAAKKHLDKLLQEYPKRDLKIISLKDFEDLFTHRQIIDIQKSKIIERGSKFVKTNKFLVSLLALILFSVLYLIIYSTDNNPDGFQIINQSVHIVNKHGKILWTTKQSFDTGLNRNADPPYVHRIYDIDNDGTNEVLMAYEMTELLDTAKSRKISCYNNFGELIWQYLFCDSISTNSEIFDTKQYYSFILDIVKEENRDVLLCISKHLYFPSAIYKLDLKTGERLDGTIWSQGHFNRGVVGDFDDDGKIELFVGGINNGLESAFTILVDYDKLKGQTPTIDEYSFKNLPVGNFRKLLLFNKTDVCRYLDLRFNNVDNTVYDINSREFLVNTVEGQLKNKIGLVYRFNQEFDSVTPQIGDDLQFERDILVKKGLINGPFTNDLEYSKILIDGIQEWDGEKFVKFNSNL